jgi:hypothetical protein
LTKSPKGREVGPNDRFSFNSGFTCPLAKIKIQTIVGKVENNEERAETQERIDEERRHQIEVSKARFLILGNGAELVVCSGMHRSYHESTEDTITQRSGQRGYPPTDDPLHAYAHRHQEKD